MKVLASSPAETCYPDLALVMASHLMETSTDIVKYWYRLGSGGFFEIERVT